MTALHVVRKVMLHVVAQVVETVFVVGAMRDVATVGHLAIRIVQIVLDHADRQAQEAVEAAHPLRVASCQVIVDRDDMHALARERVEIGRQRGHKRLAFARLHFSDAPGVQHHAADELHVEVTQQHASAGFADYRESLREDAVECFAVG